MKKTLWMLGVAVAALTSCTQSEVVDVPESRVIQFDTFVGKSTRAAIPINQHQNSHYEGENPPLDNLFQFWVFGTQSNMEELKFDGTEEKARVYYSNDNNTFTYDKHLTWEFGKTYNFAAYSNGNYPLVDNAQLDTEVTTASLVAVEFTDLKDENNDDKIYGSKLFFDDYTVGNLDLLAAITKTVVLPQNASVVDAVPLSFQHMLSLINIRLENNSKDIHMQIADMQFNAIITDDCSYIVNADNTDVTVATRTIVWENINDDYDDNETDDKINGQYTFEGTGGINADDADTETVNGAKYLAPGQAIEMTYFVIPQNNQNISSVQLTTQSYHYDESVTNGPKYTIANPVSPEPSVHNISLAVNVTGHESWQPGYVYSYVGSLTADAHPIHFKVEKVNDWEDNVIAIGGSGSSIVNN